MSVYVYSYGIFWAGEHQVGVEWLGVHGLRED